MLTYGVIISVLAYIAWLVTGFGFIARAILRPHRAPTSRIAWVVVIAVIPLLGIIAYVLIGETNIGARRVARARKIISDMPPLASASTDEAESLAATVPAAYDHLFSTAKSINGFNTFGGNSARLYSVSDETINAMIADIDAALDHVHVLFYIWLTDTTGRKMVEALKRAAEHGVCCRVVVDDLGSRGLIKSGYWQDMQDAGVNVAISLPARNPLSRLLRFSHGRIDLRNHRKIVVIDDHITYCGSQNCADAEFLVKPRYAPWVDAMMRFEGPIARQNQHLFVSDWMAAADESLNELLRQPVRAPRAGFAAQAFGTGPTVRHSAMPEMFESLMFGARQKIVITTPYYVPDESMQDALCAAARRGVDTTIVFPAHNDSFIVAAASHSYYSGLLTAGVKIFEYVGGLLHTKSFTIDGEVTLIGSANMDRRSFDLNYENNILLHDSTMTAEMLCLQEHYISKSNRVMPEEVAAWSWPRRLWNNTIAMLGPLL